MSCHLLSIRMTPSLPATGRRGINRRRGRRGEGEPLRHLRTQACRDDQSQAGRAPPRLASRHSSGPGQRRARMGRRAQKHEQTRPPARWRCWTGPNSGCGGQGARAGASCRMQADAPNARCVAGAATPLSRGCSQNVCNSTLQVAVRRPCCTWMASPMSDKRTSIPASLIPV